jgi:hypothetical protein
MERGMSGINEHNEAIRKARFLDRASHLRRRYEEMNGVSVADRNHGVSVADRKHGVSVPDRHHGVSVPDRNHGVSVPDNTKIHVFL